MTPPRLDGDHHVHSTFSDDARSTPAENLAAARRAGLREIRMVDHVRASSTHVPDMLAAVAALPAVEGLRVLTGVEAKILDVAGTIDAPIARIGTGAKRTVRIDGKPAVTHYAVERECGGKSLVRLRLMTGRTHQIRVHLSHICCPIAGDYLYGAEHPALPGRFALHSAYIRLLQPITGKIIELSDPLPDALSALLEPSGAE